MRLPRMTTRRGMIAVAILAALMGTVLSPRWRLCFEEPGAANPATLGLKWADEPPSRR